MLRQLGSQNVLVPSFFLALPRDQGCFQSEQLVQVVLFCQADVSDQFAPLMACDSDAALCGEEVAARHWAPEPPVTFSLVVNQKLPA
jgi:hypothetical protein